VSVNGSGAQIVGGTGGGVSSAPLLSTGNALLPLGGTADGGLGAALDPALGTGPSPALSAVVALSLAGSAESGSSSTGASTQPVLSIDTAQTPSGGATTAMASGPSVLSGGGLTGNTSPTATATLHQEDSVAGSPALSALPDTSVVPGTDGLASATANNQALVTGNDPLVGASALSSSQNEGSLVTAGAANSGETGGSLSVNLPSSTTDSLSSTIPSLPLGLDGQ
jgi:hypothetical protein